MRLAVNIAIMREERLLLTQREDFEAWCLPGGHVDFGESLAQAAKREAEEEVGLTVELQGLIGVYSLLPARSAGINHLAVFAARPSGGSIRLQADEVIAADYFAPDHLPQPLFWGHRQRILDAFAGRRGLARTQQLPWPFPTDLTRQELYRLRDESGLSRREFFIKHFGAWGAAGEKSDCTFNTKTTING